ncbi:MAG: DUF4350 domain-containing protein [Cyclobacteriaceae bacterium]
MKRDKIFIYAFAGLFITYVTLDFLAPKPISWLVTFKASDKNPFGGFIFNDRSKDLFDNGFEISNSTLSELAETESNIVILAERADINRTDSDKLFEILEEGGNVFIAANTFSDKLRDTLDFDVEFEYQLLNQSIFEAPESVITISDSLEYTYSSNLVSNYFELEKDGDWEVLATIKEGPIAVQRNIGTGKIVLVSNPYMFTNFGLLINNNFQACAALLSALPRENAHYTMFYKSGKGEAQTPLRFFLSEDPLRWSLYLGLFLIVLLLIISSRRQQRSIPVVLPPANTTVKYVKTLGDLFFRERNHKSAAMKLISHFLLQIKDKYLVSVEFNEKFYHQFSSKSNVDKEHVIRTFELIQLVKSQPQIEEKMLVDLSRKIEKFK